MANIPDFTMKQSFPIASVIEAAQRRAQLEQQNRDAGNKSLIEGLTAFGQGVDSLVQRRQQMAQAVKMGSAMGMAPDEVQGMTPEQVVQVGTAKNKKLDLLQLLPMVNPSVVKEPWYAAALAAHAPSMAQPTTLPPATMTPQAPAVSPAQTPTAGIAPSPDQAPAISSAPLAQPTTGSFNVSQGTTTTKPSDLVSKLLGGPMSGATSSAALKILHDNRQVPVMTPDAGIAAGSVPVGTKFEKPTNVNFSEKEEQFYQREWDKLLKETDPLNASSRTALGLASRASFQANRAIKTLSNPVVTNQEAGNAMADVAAIYQNGSPTQFGMSHQEYSTLYGRVQGVLQAISGKPQDALPDPIKKRLLGVLSDMKVTNQSLLKQRLDMTEHTKKAVIAHFPDEWKEYRQILEGDQGAYNGLNSPVNAPTLAGANTTAKGTTYTVNP